MSFGYSDDTMIDTMIVWNSMHEAMVVVYKYRCTSVPPLARGEDRRQTVLIPALKDALFKSIDADMFPYSSLKTATIRGGGSIDVTFTLSKHLFC
jgi:hypothetical protein